MDRNNNGNVNKGQCLKKDQELSNQAFKTDTDLLKMWLLDDGVDESNNTSIPSKSISRRFTLEDSMLGEDVIRGSEGKYIKPNSWNGQRIGVLTSGGDSQGMNAAVRAIYRMGTYMGCKVFYIKEGYQGMVDGGENIIEATWSSTSNMIHVGGTNIGSARCMAFKQREGRLKAALNLIQLHITNLICIGGDGSLTGADLFRTEWPSLLKELLDKEKIPRENAVFHKHLNIVGLVGSIDNDFCGTDMTIGTDSALHRIVESVDEIMTTAVSHKRAFVLEVMGRNCGYLPLVAGIAAEASFVFIPESPPPVDWKTHLCDVLTSKAKSGEKRRTHIIFVAEGAIDVAGNPIKVAEVQKVLTERMNLDTRVTVLGHVQRGGNTSAYDRILGSRMGAEAVLALRDATPDTPACVIAIEGNNISRIPLMKAVEKTKTVGARMAEKNYDSVVRLRGRPMLHNLYLYHLQQKVVPHSVFTDGSKKAITRIAMVHVGSPAAGMNACSRGFVSVCIAKGYQPVFIHQSWEGLTHDSVTLPGWNDVHFWTMPGGSLLGTQSVLPFDLGIDVIAKKIGEHKISGIVIVGGFEAFKSALQLQKGRQSFPELCIPITVVPATIANNVPGCDVSIGSDTALNQICKACGDLKMSAYSIQKCVYVVEVGGGNCGYLSTMGAIAMGADAAFIKEERFNARDILARCQEIKMKLKLSGIRQGLVFRNENASDHLTTDVFYRIFNEEGKSIFQARKSILGHTQEGCVASPYDRHIGIKSGCRSAAWLILALEACGVKTGRVFTDSQDSVTVSTQIEGNAIFKPVMEISDATDFEQQIPKHQWWLKLRPLLKILAVPSQEHIAELAAENKGDSHVQQSKHCLAEFGFEI